jgi:hypothetical protein
MKTICILTEGDYSDYHIVATFSTNCWARDKEHAEKIALDKFYQWKWEKENEVVK